MLCTICRYQQASLPVVLVRDLSHPSLFVSIPLRAGYWFFIHEKLKTWSAMYSKYEKILLRRVARCSSQSNLQMGVKICLCSVLDIKAGAFELQPHKIWSLSRGQYSLIVFLRNPVTFKRVKETTIHSAINSISFIYVLKKKKKEERKSAIFVVNLVRQKHWWRSQYSVLLTEHNSKVSSFSKHLRRASSASPAVNFRERGSEATASCLDSISVVTRRKFGANYLKAISVIIESLWIARS